MAQACAKSKAVGAEYEPTSVAKSKDYSIYSQYIRQLINTHMKSLKSTGAPQRPTLEPISREASDEQA